MLSKGQRQKGSMGRNGVDILLIDINRHGNVIWNVSALFKHMKEHTYSHEQF